MHDKRKLALIDPDVIDLAFQGNGDSFRHCGNLVEHVLNKLAYFQLVTSDNSSLFDEYLELFDTHRDTLNNITIVLLEYLVNFSDEPDKVHNIVIELDPLIQKTIERQRKLGRTESVEPTMLQIAGSSKRPMVIAVEPSGKRRRILRDPTQSRSFLKQINGYCSIDIALADHTSLDPPALRPNVPSALGLRFEEKVQAILPDILGCNHHATTPSAVDNRVGGDVDFYGYKIVDNSCKVWIGECKLFEQNSNTIVGYEKVKQLFRRKPIIRDYEASKDNIEQVIIHSYIISNGSDLSQSAWELAHEIQAVFLQAIIAPEDNWITSQKWYIKHFNMYIPVKESDKWKGKLVKTLKPKIE